MTDKRDEHSPPSPAHTSSLGGLDLDALEKVARDAPHQRGWRLFGGASQKLLAIFGARGEADLLHWSGFDGSRLKTWADRKRMASHIATFDPPTVLRLIELARASPPQPEPRDGASEGGALDREAVARALAELEAANDAVAEGRTQKTYLAMIDDGQGDALLALDNARRNARDLLAALASRPAREKEL